MTIDFFLSGFGKCGSTSLHLILRQHWDMFLPVTKDHSTALEEGWQVFQKSLPSLFFEARGEKIKGLSNVLFSGNQAGKLVPLLRSDYPDSKYLFIVRDPIKRIESEFRNLHTNGARYGIRCPMDIGRAIREIDTIVIDSAYYSKIELFREYFSEQQIKVVMLEDLLNHRQLFLDDICTFLGVVPFAEGEAQDIHANDGRHKYYDNAYLRRLRDDPLHPRAAAALNTLENNVIDQFLPQIGQRLKFNDQPIIWKDSDYSYVMERLHDDAQNLLAYLKRDISLWPRFLEARDRCIAKTH